MSFLYEKVIRKSYPELFEVSLAHFVGMESNEVAIVRYSKPRQKYEGLLDPECFFSKTVCVVAIFWARVSRHLTVEEARFRMRIMLGVVLIRFLACT